MSSVDDFGARNFPSWNFELFAHMSHLNQTKNTIKADKDKIRGMFEEGEESIPEGARREIREIMKKEAEQQRELEEQLSRREAEAAKEQPQRKGGSMWSSFRRN